MIEWHPANLARKFLYHLLFNCRVGFFFRMVYALNRNILYTHFPHGFYGLCCAYTNYVCTRRIEEKIKYCYDLGIQLYDIRFSLIFILCKKKKVDKRYRHIFICIILHLGTAMLYIILKHTKSIFCCIFLRNLRQILYWALIRYWYYLPKYNWLFCFLLHDFYMDRNRCHHWSKYYEKKYDLYLSATYFPISSYSTVLFFMTKTLSTCYVFFFDFVDVHKILCWKVLVILGWLFMC